MAYGTKPHVNVIALNPGAVITMESVSCPVAAVGAIRGRIVKLGKIVLGGKIRQSSRVVLLAKRYLFISYGFSLADAQINVLSHSFYCSSSFSCLLGCMKYSHQRQHAAM